MRSVRRIGVGPPPCIGQKAVGSGPSPSAASALRDDHAEDEASGDEEAGGSSSDAEDAAVDGRRVEAADLHSLFVADPRWRRHRRVLAEAGLRRRLVK